MISVMNEFEIDRNPNSAPDLSFLGMESPKDEEEMDPIELEIPPSLDLEGSRVRVSDPNEEAPFEMNGLVIGDMVWGKVKSHPWWPGHLYNEAFASPSVRSAKRDGLVLVAFFGDSSYGWFNPAELIPYEPNFLEKSKQTLLKSFVNAVEESIDEAGRRAALCLSCRCQNPYNFRPTRVPNYFKVDVAGYERNAVYSRRQIDKERSSFVPKDAVGFLRQLALMPRGDKVKDAEWHRKLAVWLAVRRHRFEEFDETYAQAFGQQPVRPVRNEMGVLEQSESFAPRGAPLSGPLVVADTLDENKSDSASASKHKEKKKKKEKEDESLKKKKKKKIKDEYVLKRRDEHSLSSLPDAYLPENKRQRNTPSDHVLQKREPAVTESPPAPPPVPMPALETSAGKKPAPGDAVIKNTVKKIKKRPPEDANDQEETNKLKKKKKKQHGDGFRRDSAPVFNNPTPAEANPVASPRPLSPPDVDLGPLDHVELRNVMADLRSLALDPFYGIESKVPEILHHVLLRFRSLVHSKSMVLPAFAEGDAQGSREATEKIKQRDESSSSSSKPVQLLKRPEDPTKAGTKRAPSDRQEEMLAKRMKKVNNLKSLASEKKKAPAAISQKASNNNGKASSSTEPVRKPERQQRPLPPLLPPPPRRESPTFLTMKFPLGSKLPSVSNLKARFARFGPLEVENTRVFWKSHSCRVQFKYKSDAIRALNLVKGDDVFGQIQVEYSVREVEAPAPEPEPVVPQPQPQPPQGQLKSILKKPGDEAGKESQRVKFMLSGNDNGNGKNTKKVGVSFPDVARPQRPPSPPPQSRRTPARPLPLARTNEPFKTVERPSLPPPPARSYEPYHLPPPPPVHRPVEKRAPPVPVQFNEAPKKQHEEMDISHRMLSLLMRCNDIVSRLSSLPGFVPYCPL